jgi:hypothetical protein
MNGGFRISDFGLNGKGREGRRAPIVALPFGSRLNKAIRNPQSAMRNRRPGVALVLVLFAIAFISALAVALLEGATTDLAIHRNHVQGLKALYAAHAGVAETAAALRQQYNRTSAVVGSLTAPDGTVYAYSVQIQNAAPIVTVTSTGTAAGYTRKVQARLLVAGPPKTAPYPVRIAWWKEVFGS